MLDAYAGSYNQITITMFTKRSTLVKSESPVLILGRDAKTKWMKASGGFFPSFA